MPPVLNPYINFDGNAREAMEFYKDIFGGELTVNTFGEYGDTGPSADKLMHADLVVDGGFRLMASDTPEGKPHNPGDNVSISLSGEDADELHGYWKRLSDGATVTAPLEKQVWGDEFGSCVDQFGISWLVNIVQPQV